MHKLHNRKHKKIFLILTILKWFQFSSNISRLVPLRNDFNDNGKYSWFLFDACQNLNYFSKKKKTQHISYECGWRTNRKPGSLRKQHSQSKYNWVLLKRGKNLCFNYSRYQGKSSWKIHFLFVKDSHFLSHKFAGNTITRVFLSMCFKLR